MKTTFKNIQTGEFVSIYDFGMKGEVFVTTEKDDREKGSKVCRNSGYSPRTLILWAIVVSGLSIYQGSREDCDDLCIKLRMQNQPAEVIQVHNHGGLWR